MLRITGNILIRCISHRPQLYKANIVINKGTARQASTFMFSSTNQQKKYSQQNQFDKHKQSQQSAQPQSLKGQEPETMTQKINNTSTTKSQEIDAASNINSSTVNDDSSSQQQPPNRFVNILKSAWRQTFPNQQDQIRNKYTNVKKGKFYTKEQIQKMQDEMPEYIRTALTTTDNVTKQEKPRFSVSSLIPQSVKSKITSSASYKEMTEFKENLKEYASTRDGAVANVGTMAYGFVANDSPMARATVMMRKYIPEFTMFELQKESTVLFKDAYNTFLKEDIQHLELMASQQALQYFKVHIKINKTKKQTPKYTELIFNSPAKLKKAHVGQKQLPTFEFDIKVMQIYCMVNAEGQVVDGDLERVNESIFEFKLGYSGNHMEQLGHPWELIEIKKLQEMKLLV